MATKIFLNNEWQDYNEESLYNNLGITRKKSKNIVAYDSSMNEISGWNNSGYNWIIIDNQWYSENTTPYYVFTGEKTLLYLIDEEKNLQNFVYMGIIYLQVDGSFFTSEYLHDHLGYTQTPSVVWYVDLDIPWSWYNPEENLYWDNREGKKLWTEEPPTPSVRFVMGGTLALTNEGTTTFDAIDYNQLLGIKIGLTETIKETGILSVNE